MRSVWLAFTAHTVPAWRITDQEVAKVILMPRPLNHRASNQGHQRRNRARSQRCDHSYYGYAPDIDAEEQSLHLST